MLSKESVLDALSKLLEKKIKIREYERDMVFIQNEFQIKNKSGSIVNLKYDLITFGGHNNMPYTATSILVGFPAAIVAQVKINFFKYLI